MRAEDLGLESAETAVAVVGIGAILPDAPDAAAFWENVKAGRNSIGEVPADRWDPNLFFDPDHSAPDRTYSKIGGWVRGFRFDSPKFRIPPSVAAAMDRSQQWMLLCARDALKDAGVQELATVSPERIGVVLGNALGGDLHYTTSFRILLPEVYAQLAQVPEFEALPETTRAALVSGLIARMGAKLPQITEDTMPGELGNVIAGRVANALDLKGPNFTCDAACASSLAAIESAIGLLLQKKADAVVTGGVDSSMGPTTFVKFCKIGALSADGSRPFDLGANGFVMGEGSVAFVLRRLEDAERDGQKIYAVIRSIGASSDGKGKGITAPNPKGQLIAVRRAWQQAGLSPRTLGLVEAHGTSTKAGDASEIESLTAALSDSGLAPRTIALGSVKSQIGHLKSAAGAAGMLKAIYALHHRILPPTINVRQPNPALDLERSPLFLNHTQQPWEAPATAPRRAAVSSFGFGGTNFHVVLEEYVPGLLRGRTTQVPDQLAARSATQGTSPVLHSSAPGGMGTLCLGAATLAELKQKLSAALDQARRGNPPPSAGPRAEDLKAHERLVISYEDPAALVAKAEKTLELLSTADEKIWKALQARGIFRGTGPAAKVAFLFPGQGSQYLGMLKKMRETFPVVRRTFEEADAAMEGKIPRRLSSYIFAEGEQAELELRDTMICQPAMLTIDISLMRLLGEYGIAPDMVMGHSLGEYAALVACGAMPFADALLAVSARAKEMSSVSIADNGKMASIFAPYEAVQQVISRSGGYVVAANLNSRRQTVIGGATRAVEEAVAQFTQLGVKAVFIPVSHAFHTEIVAPASAPLRNVLDRLNLSAPKVTLISNVTGEPYPADGDVREKMLDLLARQIASPVQFVKGLETLHRLGAGVFVEVGPKRVLASFVEDVLGDRGALAVSTNHPKKGEFESFTEALCGLWAAGLGNQKEDMQKTNVPEIAARPATQLATVPTNAAADQGHLALGKLFASFLEEGMRTYQGHFGQAAMPALPAHTAPRAVAQPAQTRGSVVVTGASVGLPGRSRQLFADDNFEAILRGDCMIDPIPQEIRERMVSKQVVRLVKGADGSARFETISDTAEVIKLAGQKGRFDLVEEFGIDADRVAAFDTTTQMALAAALLALRDAGIPLVRRYKQTSKGGLLPDRWTLPESLADETGVVFASAFPGYDALLAEVGRHHEDLALRTRLEELKSLRGALTGEPSERLEQRIAAVESELATLAYQFDRKFLWHVLAMGHSQLAELIGARGPNSQINAACSSAAQAVGLANDWVRSGRCRRVIVVSADEATSNQMLEWIGTGFLSSGAASTEADVTKAALPFDRRRHGLIVGMGACGLVVEAEDAVRERGMRGIAELLGVEISNSAFHGSRLDVDHIGQVMERLVSRVEAERGLNRQQMAGETVFVSHETFTPARGGSAAAEIHSLRRVFGPRANEVVIANTKGMTGHGMGAGIEEAVTVKILETGVVPPVPNLREPDPELGDLRISKGGNYPVRYALRLAAGFGSQVAISLFQKVGGERVADAATYRRWLEEQSGRPGAATVVEKRTLRVRDDGPPQRQPARSTWSFGAGPSLMTETAAPRKVEAPRPVAAATAAAPAPVAVAAPVPAAARVDVSDKLLAIVSEKTGYPREMLAMDLDLEADLGIDTVKQAEIFSELRTTFDLPRQDDFRLRDYPTLNHLVGLIEKSRGGASAQPAAAAPHPFPLPQAGEGDRSAPAASPAGAQADAGNSAEIADKLLAIVSEKTGYPRDMLALDLDLEADLGIDTVKQAEIFSELRTAFDLPRQDDFRLRDYPTLNHLIGLIEKTRGGASAQPAASTPATTVAPMQTVVAAQPHSAAGGDAEIADKLLAIVSEKTGYPREMLELDLDLEADLGIDTVKQAEIFSELRATFDLPRQDDFRLRDFPTLNHLIGLIQKTRGGASAQPATAPHPFPLPQAGEGDHSAPSASPAVAQAATGGDAEIAEKLLAIVSEKTGYPREMLELDLDLEADLGIDTVKQAEIFSELRATFDLPRQDYFKLRDYPTLNHLIGLIEKSRAQTSAAAAAPASAPQATASQPEASASTSSGAVRHVPLPVLRPELDLCKATGIRLEQGARVLIVADESGVAASLASKLEAAGVEVLRLTDGPIDEQLAAIKAGGALTGVFHLPALDVESDLPLVGPEMAAEIFRPRIRTLFAVARGLLPELGKKGTFLVAGTRFGGLHGYGSEAASAPAGGAVSGFVKAFSRECTEATVKVVDFALEADADTVAQALIDEALRDPGAVEIGYAFGARHAIAAVVEQRSEQGAGLKLGPDSVALVTGAAGGITAAIVGDLARESRATFYLMDLAPAPEAGNPDLARIATDREGLRNDLFARMKATGERVTPAQVERVLAGLERDAAVLSAIRTIEGAGGKVHYRSVNVMDPAAVAAVVDEVRATHGRIDLVLHAAGLERSKLLADKPAEEFDRIFDVKVYGVLNVLRAAEGMPIGALVSFSSVAGRFGNGGQTDYSSANDFLCKLTSAMRRFRPETQAIALDWTAWAGAGMATRGSIPEMMRRAGIEMLPLEEGLPVVRLELAAGIRGERVVGKGLGMLLAARDAEGGLDLERVAARLSATPLPMVGRVLGFDLNEGLKVETTLDPEAEPFLRDHAIDGIPVLPGVMGLEGFAEVARLLLSDFQVAGLESVRFEAPMKYYRKQPRPGLFRGLMVREASGQIAAHITLSSSRALPNGATQELQHFCGKVLLTRDAQAPREAQLPAARDSRKVSPEEIYRVFFHGPAYQVLEGVEMHGEGAMGRFRADLPPALASQEAKVLFSPRLIELCLQTAGVYELGKTGRMALPSAIDRIVSHAVPSESQTLCAEVTPRQDGEGLCFDAHVRDGEGRIYLELAGYRTSALPAGLPEELIRPLRTAVDGGEA